MESGFSFLVFDLCFKGHTGRMLMLLQTQGCLVSVIVCSRA